MRQGGNTSIHALGWYAQGSNSFTLFPRGKDARNLTPIDHILQCSLCWGLDRAAVFVPCRAEDAAPVRILNGTSKASGTEGGTVRPPRDKA